MSIAKPELLCNSQAKNYLCALAYPSAVQEYLQKETNLRVMLGPVNNIDNKHYHCSPLLTCPKDGDKGRVILSPPYPYRFLVNDQVNKFEFDGRHFTLKFPSVDIVEDILNTDDPVIFKVDVACSFNNLRVDPVDAVKFGISWNDQFYVNLSVTFGWMHRSAAFQITSDIIAFMMKDLGCKVHAYIDDYVIVALRSRANEFVHALVILLQDLTPQRSLLALAYI